jgi:hypothetical protein
VVQVINVSFAAVMILIFKPSDALTLTTNGKTHLEIVEQWYRMREDDYRRGVNDGKKLNEITPLRLDKI